jgi:hypothetical protein
LPPLIKQTVGAQLIVRVEVHAIFPNCPRYIPKIQLVEPSVYTPRDGIEPPEPAWKSFPDFKDAVHPRQRPTAAATSRKRMPQPDQLRRGERYAILNRPRRSSVIHSIAGGEHIHPITKSIGWGFLLAAPARRAVVLLVGAT